MNHKALFFIIIFLCAPVFAHAETVLRIGQNISVDADQVVDGDYYVFVGPLSNTTMSGKVNGDVNALGGEVTVNGTVGSDLFVVGGVTQMHASVADDVRIVGGEVTIGEHIGGDLFVVGGSLKVLSTASVDGDIFFFGGDAEINGKVGGSIMGAAQKMRIDADVAGNVDVKTTRGLTLGDKAHIAGSAHYTSLSPLVRAQNAIVDGEVSESPYLEKSLSTKSKARTLLVPIFIVLFAALSLFLLFRSELQKLVESIEKKMLRSMLVGLGVLFLGPVVALLLTVTVLGMLLGIIGFGLLLVVYIVGFLLSGVLLGAYIAKLFTKKMKVSLLFVVIGTVAAQLLLMIPFLGAAVVLVFFSMAVGGLTISVYKLFS